MRDALTELVRSRATTTVPQYAMLPSVAPLFACPLQPMGMNLYALAFTAAQMSVREADRQTKIRRFSASVN